jgi:hypothetical protein
MHTKPTIQDLQAVATSDECVTITIDKDLSLEGSKLLIKGPERLLIMSLIPTSHVIEVCVYTGKPMFVELETPSGTSVQYVKKSGSDFYNN